MAEDRLSTPQEEKITGVMSAKQVAATVENLGTVIADKLAEAVENMGMKMKEPTVAEARKLKQQEVLEKRARQARLDEARMAMKDRDERIEKCRRGGHSKPGKTPGTFVHAWRGNLNSDGCVRPSCIRCGHQLPPFKAPQGVLQGASVNEWFESMPSLTEEVLIKWSKDTNNQWWIEQERKATERQEIREAFAL